MNSTILSEKDFLGLSSVQFSSVAQSCLTLCDPMNHSTPGLLPITNSRSSLRLMSIESVMPSSHLILCCPLLLLPQSLSASESFPMSQLFTWGGQSGKMWQKHLCKFFPGKLFYDLEVVFLFEANKENMKLSDWSINLHALENVIYLSINFSNVPET